MSFALWLALGGTVLLFMALSGTLLSRIPVSTSMLYLLAGLAAGRWGWPWRRRCCRRTPRCWST
jgi:NhaP-type Na+/H+ or K+/H+ antiporter